MSQDDTPVVGPSTLSRYIAGFLLSLGLTLTAYAAVQHHISTGHTFPSDHVMVAILFGLAIAQLAAQLVFFLHLNRESKPRRNLLAFILMLIVVIIVAGGSLWIMHNLDYHMSAKQESQYLLNQESGGI